MLYKSSVEEFSIATNNDAFIKQMHILSGVENYIKLQS